MVDCFLYLVLIVMLMKAFVKMKEVIVGVMVQDVEVCLNRSATIYFTMMEKALIVVVKEYKGIRPSLIPTIIQVILVYHWFLIVLVMTEVDTGLRPANFLHITMVEYTFPTHSSLNKLFQGECKDKFHIKIILIIIIQA